MAYQDIFERYELKYLLTQKEKENLYKIMDNYMEPDEYWKSTIRNIYYDTPNHLLIRRSLEKPKYKEKLRVRSYYPTKPDSTVFIEIKKKYKGIVYKRRIDLTEKTASNYLVYGIPLENPSQISKEIDYFMDYYKNVVPAMFVSYYREAYHSKTDSNFRITFDENVITRDYDLSLTSDVYGEEDLLEGGVILEVKTVQGIPQWLVDFFSENRIYRIPYSKYGRAYEKYVLPKRFKDIYVPESNYINGGMRNVI